MPKMYRVMVTVLAILLITVVVSAINEEMPPAIIENDEGGVQVIQGEVAYTWPLFTAQAADGFIMLEDQTGFVNRDYHYVFPAESQIFAQITSDVFQSPFSYTVQLPVAPQAPLNDVDHDNEDDIGIQIFQVAYWTNTFGDIYLEERDGSMWSGNYASARVESEPPERIAEYIGGKVIIYAPVEGQAFPSGFGNDARLFTDDDPLVIVPQGWSVVDMDTVVFTFDRSRTAQVDLIEAPDSEPQDVSDLSYPEAFDALVEYFRERYAFTEHKNIDWDALHAEYRPRFEAAEEAGDVVAYALAMRDFEWEFDDGHASMGSWFNYLNDNFLTETDGGLGIAIRETSDERVIVDFLLPDSPADEAGIELGAEILEMNGRPILDAVDDAIAWSFPFSTDHTRRLQQLRYVTRSYIGDEVDITFRNPDSSGEETVTMVSVNERESFSHSSFFEGVDTVVLPIEWDLIGTYYHVRIRSFFESPRLTVQLWERMIDEANQNGVTGLILDMRNNSGGWGQLADYMAGYFFDEDMILGYGSGYEEHIGEFYMDERFPDEMLVAPPEKRFNGDVVLLVAPTCVSACELFSYNMSLENRATLIGQYPTAGATGGWSNIFIMPEGFSVVLPTGRAIDVDGNIIGEGDGIPPDIVVPVNEDTLGLTDAVYLNGDVLLDAAVNFLGGGAGNEIIEAGEIGYNEEITDTLEAGQRIRYTFTIEADADPVGIYIVSEMDTYLRVYDENGTSILVENDNFAGTTNSGFSGIALDRALDVIIEVASASDSESGEYTLIVTTGEHPFDIAIVDVGTLAVGDTVSEELAEGERHSYTLELDADETVNIRVEGEDNLDTYLRIYDEDGNLLAENDDIEEDNQGSIIEGFSVDNDSTVTIEISTFEDSTAGSYELVVEAAD